MGRSSAILTSQVGVDHNQKSEFVPEALVIGDILQMQESTPTPLAAISILKASRAGNLSEVVESLRKGDDVNARDGLGRTPLMLATIGAHVPIIELLLQRRGQPDIEDKKGRTPLMHSALMGNQEVTDLLLRARANPNLKDQKGRTALQNAIDSRDVEGVRLLLSHDADPDETDSDGFTLTRHLLRKKQTEIANLLIEYGGKGEQEAELIKSIEAGSIDGVRLMLARGVDPNTRQTNGDTALMLAAERGLVDVAKALLERGADMEATDKDGCTVLMHISTFFHWLSPAANGKDQASMLRLLVTKGVAIDTTDKGGNTALMKAAPCLHPYDIQIVHALLDNNADVHVKNVDGRNALALALLPEGGNEEIIEALLSRGADPNSTLPTSDLSDEPSEDASNDLEGMSVLIWAAMFGREGVIKLLLGAGAAVNKRLNNGLTALHFAALRGDTPIVKQLVSKGADLPRYGLEALVLASKTGAIAQYLIGCGVDHNLVNPKLIEESGRGTIDTAALTMRTEGILSRARAIDRYMTEGVRAKPVSGGLPGQGKRR